MSKISNKKVRSRYITVFATFLAFMGIGVVDPILPTIAKHIGASHWQIEMLFTAYILTMAIMMIPSGILATKLGDKKMMCIGLGIVTIFSLLCAVSNGISQLSIFRAGWGFGNSMFFATAMMLLIAFSDDANRAIGLYEAAIGLGMAGGPLLGGILGGYSWRYPFIATSCLIFIAFILVKFLVYQPEVKTKRKAIGGKELINLIKFPPFIKVAMASMCYFYGFFVILAYSPLVIKLSPIKLGFVFFGWGLMLAYGSAVLSHRLEKKFQPSVILPWSLVIFMIFLGGLYFTNSLEIRIALVVLSGLVSGLNNALFTSHVMEVSPYERGITSGAYNFVRWLGAAIAPVLSGVIGHAFSSNIPFALASVVMLVGIFLVAGKHKQEIELEKVAEL
ncbi:MFS transporter [Romboutsia sp.]|uniref:MFS transporter n=1 Tax=Romboutsia sp. TaxID=1965302 RepID=UPI002BC015C2|nr:MFS transporter [Romboutsia sp.]HSQ87410.1 MFS transporter [Romboutsia sp.]